MPNTTTSLSGSPTLVAHFTIQVGSHDLPLLSVSDLHDIIEPVSVPQVIQSVRLRRAVSTDRFLYDWYDATRRGKDTATKVTLRLLDGPAGKAVNIWILENARPVRWTGPGLDALGNRIAMEELELIYDSVRWVDT